MKCRQILSRLSAYQDDECSDRITAEIRGHLDGCPSCLSQLHDMEKTISKIKTLSEIDPHNGLKVGIMSEIKTNPPRRWLLRPSLVYPVVFLLCLAIGYVFSGSTQTPTAAEKEYQTLSQILTENQQLALITVHDQTLALLSNGGPHED